MKAFKFCLTIVLIFLLACSHRTTTKPPPKIDKNNSFGFLYEGHNYNFTYVKSGNKKERCEHWEGYKDGVLEYQFSPAVFRELNEIYEEETTPEERISLAMKRIELTKTNPQFKECNPIRSKKTNLSEGIGWGIIGGLVLYAVWPVYVMIGSGIALDELTDKMVQIHLGMPEKEVLKIIGVYEVKKRIQSGKTLYVVDRHQTRAIFYFTEEKLSAYVRGRIPRSERSNTF